MEHTRCALCGSDEPAPVFRTRDRNWRLPGVFEIVRCGGCGLVYMDPRPAPREMAGYYPQTFCGHENPEGELEDLKIHGTPWERVMAVRARPLLRRKSRGRLLDVGCSAGLFLLYMKSRGWSVSGVEPRESSARTARERFGLDVFHGYFEEAEYPSGSFDAVTMNHVLEHVYDPGAAVRRVSGLLAPGGAAMFDVPNFAGIESRLFGERWVAVDAPRHLYHFTPRTLRELLKRNGLARVEIVHGSDVGRYKPGWSESLRHLVSDFGLRSYPDKPRTEAAFREAAARGGARGAVGAAHALENSFFAAAAHVANALRLGGRITAVAWKD